MNGHPIPSQDEVQIALGNRFDIQATLQPGAQGAVYRAIRHQNLSGITTEDAVAIKLYLDPTQNERVEREIRTMTEVRHYSLANLYEHGIAEIQTRHYKYVVWELVNGDPLDALLRGAGPVTHKEAAIIAKDVAAAIAAIWVKRIVHRDVNPKNIMLRSNREGAVLLDLGVAKYIDLTTLTPTGLTWGTRGYLSPEQMIGLELTCQSDVFSLGISIQEALTGRHPTGLDQTRLVSGGPRTATLCPSCPAGFAVIVDKMVSHRPAHRPSPIMLVEQLEALREAV